MSERVLFIGQDGRTEALARQMTFCPEVDKIICAPGNAATAKYARTVNVSQDKIAELGLLAEMVGADLTIPCQEGPLIHGIVDEFRSRDLNIVGPPMVGARLEGDKIWQAEFMDKYEIPHPLTASFKPGQTQEAISYHRFYGNRRPIALKGQGEYAGKGVLITPYSDVSEKFIKTILEEKGDGLIVQEFVEGIELSFLNLTDGITNLNFPYLRDFKRLKDGDIGPNTGSMGCEGPFSVSPHLNFKIQDEVIEKVYAGMKAEGIDYKGFLYPNIMITPDGKIKVLEYNVRPGNCEAQLYAALSDFNWYNVLRSTTDGSLSGHTLTMKELAGVCVVMAVRGYPTHPRKGAILRGLESVNNIDTFAYIAESRQREYDKNEYLMAAGGRPITLAAIGENIEVARQKAYDLVGKKIYFVGEQHRTDIGANADQIQQQLNSF